MTELRLKSVMIKDIRSYLETDLDSAIASLQAYKHQYEAEGYTKLHIDISPYDEYGSATVDVELTGVRLETESEAKEREAREKAALQQTEASARRQYEALKAKFG